MSAVLSRLPDQRDQPANRVSTPDRYPSEIEVASLHALLAGEGLPS